MKIKISNKKLGFPGIKITLGALTAMLLAGIVFSVVQIVTASTNPDPGHVLSQIADINCDTGYCLQKIINGAPTCMPCSGGTGGVGGSGTANYVAKWATASTIGNSQLVDNGQGVGVGSAPRQTTPGSGVYWPLDVYGAIHSDFDINADNRVRGAKVCIGGTVGTDTGCRTTWPTYYNLTCQQVSGGTITVDDTYAITVSCPSGYQVVRCEWASVGNRNIYPITLSSYPSLQDCVFNFKDPDFGTGQVIPAAYCCQ